MKVIWSPTAERNLDAVWEYIAQDNIDAADQMIARLRTASGYLADHPLIGRMGRARGTREFVVSGTPYILLYRPLRSHIDVARVIHGAQDWPPKG
jgi:toxin ParE1/3/4